MHLLSELLMGASQFKKLYESQCENILCRFSLKQIELDILLFLANNPPYDTARDIAELRGLAKSNLSTAIERLSGDGYLTSRVDPRDRRFAHLSLTEKARPVVSQGKACLLYTSYILLFCIFLGLYLCRRQAEFRGRMIMCIHKTASPLLLTEPLISA